MATKKDHQVRIPGDLYARVQRAAHEDADLEGYGHIASVAAWVRETLEKELERRNHSPERR